MRQFPAYLRMPQWKKIEKVEKEAKDVKTFYFRFPEIIKTARPGKFFIVCVFKHMSALEEVPISLSYINGEVVGISVKAVGPKTKALYRHSAGDTLGLRGPYGHGYRSVKGKIALVGGGIGMAPLIPLVKEGTDVFLGARNKDYLYFVERIKNIGANLYLATNDGSQGEKGLITDILEEKAVEYDCLMASGPEMMLKKILEICNRHKVSLQAGIERRIECGRRLCGHCAINHKTVCQDGPVFSGSVLNELSDFGRFALDICGERRPIKEVFRSGL